MLGKIAEPYGVKGWIKIHPYADDPLAWAEMPSWWVGREQAESWSSLKLIHCKAHGTVLLAQLDGLHDRTAAEALKGCLVGAPRDALPALATDEYYWADLVGLTVQNGEGLVLGTVAGLIETGANDVLRVACDGQPERLLPYVDAVVKQVDLTAGRILVEWGADW